MTRGEVITYLTALAVLLLVCEMQTRQTANRRWLLLAGLWCIDVAMIVSLWWG